MIRLAAVALVSTAVPASAQNMAPLHFLVGHCWQGVLPDGDSDRHCFSAARGHVTDHHAVLHTGKQIYSGDTVYAWDAGAIGWTYRDADGGVMKGSVRAATDGLDFGSADYVGPGGAKITIATHWVWIGKTAYEVRDVSTFAAHNRTTRYVRVGKQPG